MNPKPPRVTVVVDGDAPLPEINETLETVLTQTMADLEVILLAPADEECVLPPQDDPRVRVWRVPAEQDDDQLGEMVRGSWVAYAHDGVRWDADYLARALAAFGQETKAVRVNWRRQHPSGRESEVVPRSKRLLGIPPVMWLQPMVIAAHAVIHRRGALGSDVGPVVTDSDSLRLAVGLLEIREPEAVAVIADPLMTVHPVSNDRRSSADLARDARAYLGAIWERAVEERLFRWSVEPSDGLRPKWWAPQLHPDRWLAPRARLWMEATEALSDVTVQGYLGQRNAPVPLQITVNGVALQREFGEPHVTWTLPCCVDQGDDVILDVVVDPPFMRNDAHGNDRRELGMVLGAIGATISATPPQVSDPAERVTNSDDRPILGSVILSYRRPELLLHTVESYLAATTVPHELVIVDGGTIPETQRVIEELQIRYPHITAVLLDENVGGLGFDIGADLLRAPYIHFSGDDIAYHAGWDLDVIRTMEVFPEIGQYGLHFKEQPNDMVRLRRSGIAVHVYPSGTTGGTSVVRQSVRDLGIRWGNEPDHGTGVHLPADGRYTAQIHRAGFLLASPDRMIVEHLGNSKDERARRPDYYARNRAAKRGGPAG